MQIAKGVELTGVEPDVARLRRIHDVRGREVRVRTEGVVTLVRMTVSYGVSIGNDGNLGSELFLQLEEGFKNLLSLVEVVVYDVDEQRLVHHISHDLARLRAWFIDLCPLVAEFICFVLQDRNERPKS